MTMGLCCGFRYTAPALPRELTMWWLSFRDGTVVFIEASSLSHARLLAPKNGLGRVSHFVDGYFIDFERAMPIPPAYVGRVLSPIEARQLWELLEREPQGHGTERSREPAAPTSRHATNRHLQAGGRSERRR